ncbi:hypothetical protein H9L10_01970 [Phycicoccus endophyticus]|uniref:Uncharacterized protein n=1 Tax=Phycicoccus endophyticus TaxID=1690220 RepID=A0A7G9R2Q5_9MICO|nr:hypothetical protein [Phycicoccus endophyticus]NHI20347.1 hypothetical protein [Phycicoccus endophyticus]QNN49880.1 hypothetical protein H9L10_01970 [Phycicoccus endophyticus]GGL29954.1 hypothetical protein GCM10012283_10420 [Phycicoccus endophyticus]
MTEPSGVPPVDPADPSMPPDPPARRRSRTVLLVLLVALAGLAGVAGAAATDRLDTAVLFVGIPCLLALGIGVVPGSGGWGGVVQTVTVVLLLTSALLGEAAVCVLLAAPLVYGVAGLVYAAVGHARRVTGSLALVPVLAIVLVEGVLPGTRIHPEQTATASRVVSSTCAGFEAALARGPRIDPAADRGVLLRVFPYPTPTAAQGNGLRVGDRWRLTTAGGELTTRVTDRADRSVGFAVETDSSRLGRWVTVREGRLSWRPDEDGCRATMTVGYERHLDPALYFGPLTDVFMDAGVAAFLAGVD